MNLPRPHAKQLEVFNNYQRRKVLNWGRRSGKSTLAGEFTLVEAIKRQGRYFIIAPTYKQAKSIYWNDVIKSVVPKEMIAKKNETELSITLHHISGEVTLPNGKKITVHHDTDLNGSTIELKGADNPDSLRGVSLSGVVLDEYAFMKDGKEVWDKIIRPALGDKRGWAIFISTPDGIHNHFYDLASLAQEEKESYFYSHATALDNPYFPQEEFEEARIEYEKAGRTDEFVQEWMAEFKTPSKLVYRKFDRAIHVLKDANEVPAQGTYAMGIDFGFTDPFAAVLVLIDFNDNWYIIDEIYQSQLTLDQALLIMRAKMGGNRYSRVVGDSAAATELETLRKRQFPIVGAKKGKDSIKAGIREITAKLNVREGTGKPKLFILPHCKSTIKEFESYSYLEDSWGKISETPEDTNNHALDALRYLALDHAQFRRPRPKTQKFFDPVTGRALS